ncbi:hypothetical protein V8G54_011934 [Vigna mungo]|uniref:Uncharacterized protein n=1 Tax=Vigna mungo TaxID=3915 RepID=A0AAQ3NS15_VIGMU
MTCWYSEIIQSRTEVPPPKLDQRSKVHRTVKTKEERAVQTIGKRTIQVIKHLTDFTQPLVRPSHLDLQPKSISTRHLLKLAWLDLQFLEEDDSNIGKFLAADDLRRRSYFEGFENGGGRDVNGGLKEIHWVKKGLAVTNSGHDDLTLSHTQSVEADRYFLILSGLHEHHHQISDMTIPSATVFSL